MEIVGKLANFIRPYLLYVCLCLEVRFYPDVERNKCLWHIIIIIIIFCFMECCLNLECCLILPFIGFNSFPKQFMHIVNILILSGSF